MNDDCLPVIYPNPNDTVPGIREYMNKLTKGLRLKKFPKPKKQNSKGLYDLFKLLDGKASDLGWPSDFSEEGWERVGKSHK